MLSFYSSALQFPKSCMELGKFGYLFVHSIVCGMKKYAVGINLWLSLWIFWSKLGTRLREIHGVGQTGVKEDYELVVLRL